MTPLLRFASRWFEPSDLRRADSPRGSSSLCEVAVVQVGDAEHGEVHAVALQTTVTEDLPALHSREGVLDTGADLRWEVLRSSLQARRSAGRAHGGTGSPGRCSGSRRPRSLCSCPKTAFTADSSHALRSSGVAGHWPADGDNWAGVGVDNHLVVGGAAVDLGLFGNLVFAGRHQGCRPRSARCPCPIARGAAVPATDRDGRVDDAVGRGPRDLE